MSSNIELQRQLDCHRDGSMWLDTLRGVFCRGPKGPKYRMPVGLDVKDLPLHAELLQEGVLFRYLISRKLDRQAVDALSRPWYSEASQVQVDRVTVISTQTNTILAVASTVWKAFGCLGGRTKLPNGATRFTVLRDHRLLRVVLDNQREVQYAWLVQALSVFHAHRVSLEGDLRKYKLVLPHLLKGTLSQSKAKRRRRKQFPPVYLFVPASSTSTFWSFDPDGHDSIPNDLCDYLGLPVRLSSDSKEFIWETLVYKRLQDYQIARGFDPTTTDFARLNKYHCIYDIVEGPLSNCLRQTENPVASLTLMSPETTEGSPSPIIYTSHDEAARRTISGASVPSATWCTHPATTTPAKPRSTMAVTKLTEKAPKVKRFPPPWNSSPNVIKNAPKAVSSAWDIFRARWEFHDQC
ncbi:hypothetical protein V5O48_017554 [Marasmius crinis-equi]|uniref:Uncharacterized protein n=1 Tax=Marasmius crinis-equi TaxID=585013 RepID=A0ABR3ENN0_9AGAR